MKKKIKLDLKAIYNSKLFLVGALIVLVFISISFAQELIRRAEINREIEKLRSEVSDLEERNADLADVITYLNSPNWQEKESRTKLNLKKEGENVVITPYQETNELSNENIIINQPLAQVSNPQKWLNYFIN